MSLFLETTLAPTVSWSEFCERMGEPAAALRGLSPAERVVAAHLCLGLSNREIAVVLGKSQATVKNQVSTCLRKLGVATRARLIARLHGLGSPPNP